MSLFIFDKDGTLVKGSGISDRKVRNPLKPEEQMLRMNVFEKIAELRRQGHVIAIATNQSSVARGLITIEQADELVRNCTDKIGGVDTYRFCPYDPKGKKTLNGKPNPYARDDENRKPHPGMVLSIMEELGFAPKDTYMIGDKKVDEEAARAAGTFFIYAKDFFKK